MKFLKRRASAIVAACLMASGAIAAAELPARADFPTEYLDRTIYLEDPPPAGSPTAGLLGGGPRQIRLAAGDYIWCVELTPTLSDSIECRTVKLNRSGDYNWRCYLTHYNQSTYYGNCVLDLLPAGASAPAGPHYYSLPAVDGSRMYWIISGNRHYGWRSSLNPLF